MSAVLCAKCHHHARVLERSEWQAKWIGSTDGLIIYVCRQPKCGWRQATLKLEWIT